MFRKLTCALVVLGFASGLALAQQPAQQEEKKQTLQGKIVKMEENKIHFQAYDRQTKEFGQTKILMVAPATEVKVFQMKEDKKQPVAQGLQAAPLKNIGPKGQFATLQLREGRVTEIQLHDDDRFLKAPNAQQGDRFPRPER